MKKIIFIAFLWLSFIGYAQDNYIVTTDDGRRVLLKADYTWEYIDLVPQQNQPKPNVVPQARVQERSRTLQTPVEEPVLVSKNCNVGFGFVEPKLDRHIQNQLKKGRATMRDLKKRVAKTYDCTVDDVLLLYAKETKANGNYTFCANGVKVAYKRTGSNFFRKGKFF